MALPLLLVCIIGECSIYDDDEAETIAGPAGVGGFAEETAGFTATEAELKVFRTDGETEEDMQDPSNDSPDDEFRDDDCEDVPDEDSDDDCEDEFEAVDDEEDDSEDSEVWDCDGVDVWDDEGIVDLRGMTPVTSSILLLLLLFLLVLMLLS